jgi:O-antigen/teichoic acid export membrane protein
VPYVILTARNVKVALRWDVTKSALAFGLPLVPHTLATWVLEFADRAILERFVSLDDLGLYSMGYTFGSHELGWNFCQQCVGPLSLQDGRAAG